MKIVRNVVACTVLLLTALRVAPAGAGVVQTVSPRELWRLEGNDPSFQPAIISSVAMDADGNTYLLDARVCEVIVVSPGGKVLRRFGRPGEGPGDLGKPTRLFVTEDGELAVVHLTPPRFQYLTPAGDYIRDFRLESSVGDAMLVTTARPGPSSVIVEAQDLGFEFNDWGLYRCSRTGERVSTLTHQRDETDGKMRLGDQVTDIVTWDVCPDGWVFASLDHGRYRVQVWGPDGAPAPEIERKYEHLDRPKDQQERLADYIRGMASQVPAQVDESFEPYYRDIVLIHAPVPRHVFVLDSRGAFARSGDDMGTYGVFGCDGADVGELRLKGVGNPIRDHYEFVSSRLFVVVGAQHPAISGYDESELELEPMTVICYEFDAVETVKRMQQGGK